MARISVIRNTYGGLEYLQNALNYVSDSRALCIGGFGVNPYDSSMAYDQMIRTRQYFGKVSGNPLVHIVIAYDNSVRNIETASQFGQQCAYYFANRFQLLYCTHEKDVSCGHFHTHIIINSVSYINGQMIQTGYAEMNDYCRFVTQVTGQETRFYFENKAEY